MSLTIASPGISSPAVLLCAPCRCRRAAGLAAPSSTTPAAGRAMVAHTPRRCVPCLALMRLWSCYRLKMISLSAMCLIGRAMARVARVGGASRAHSVANGLNELLERGAQPHDRVLVHDAARCLISVDAVNRLIDACLPDEVGGILALPLADTLENSRARSSRLDEGGWRPLIASAKWTAQTPQMFRLGFVASSTHAGFELTRVGSVHHRRSQRH